jgi:hypothetical protein
MGGGSSRPRSAAYVVAIMLCVDPDSATPVTVVAGNIALMFLEGRS